MTIERVSAENQKLLRDISESLKTAKKIVVVTGAGISTSCGIPDFRSQDGLYSLINAEHNARLNLKQPTKAKGHIKGKDLFDANLWKNEDSTSVFYTFIASFRRKIRNGTKTTSATHKFIRRLRDQKKLVRCYTQNIDGLEAREGFCLDLERGKGSRGRFTKKSLDLPNHELHNVPGGQLEGGCEVVQLHGDLESLRCTICRYQGLWGGPQEAKLLQGQAPACPNCIRENRDRRDRGKRGSAVGTLRPNVVLYGEENPASEAISSLVSHDLRFGPDLLLVLGTSLKVHGLKNIVKEFAKAVHTKRNGKVIFVNLSPPAESVWKDTIDYWVDMKCDDWACDKFRDRQTQIPFKPGKRNNTAGAKYKPRKDKENIEKLTLAQEDVNEVIEVSPIKQPENSLPTPPPSGRRILGDMSPTANRVGKPSKDSLARCSIDIATPSRRCIQKNRTPMEERPGSSHDVSPRKCPVVMITPIRNATTPRKRQKTQKEFIIWDSEDDGASEHGMEMQELGYEVIHSPSARGRKRRPV